MVREWKSEDISQETLERVIAAGLKAPTHDHQRNWEFIILHSQQEKETALQFAKAWSVTQEENSAVSTLGTIPQSMYAYAMPRYTMLLTVPYVVIPLFKGAGIFHAMTVNGLNSFASIWCVAENIFLAATAEGLACSMRIPVGEEGKLVASVLGVPEGYVVPCYIGIGYPVENSHINRLRSLSEILCILESGKRRILKMEFYEVINKRRSIRQFEDKEIPREVLERVLDAGLKAPSSNHQRRWELITLTDKAIIMDLANFIRPYPCRIQEPKTPQQEMFKIAYPRQRSMIEESACVILPYFKQKYTFDNDKNGYGLMDYGAVWTLVENMLLAATAEGLGSVVHIPVKKEPEQIKAFLKIPDGYYLPALVVLGYPAKEALLPTQVKATVENKVHWNKW